MSINGEDTFLKENEMKTLSIVGAIVALTVAFAPSLVLASDPCKDGTAPDGWKRAGGYCEVSANQHIGGDGNFAGSGTTTTDGTNFTVVDKNGAVLYTYTN